MSKSYYHAVPLNREMLSKFKSAMGIPSTSNDVELALNLHYQFGSASLLDFNSDVDFWVSEEVLPLNYLPFSYATRGTDEVSVPYISAGALLESLLPEKDFWVSFKEDVEALLPSNLSTPLVNVINKAIHNQGISLFDKVFIVSIIPNFVKYNDPYSPDSYQQGCESLANLDWNKYIKWFNKGIPNLTAFTLEFVKGVVLLEEGSLAEEDIFVFLPK